MECRANRAEKAVFAGYCRAGRKGKRKKRARHRLTFNGEESPRVSKAYIESIANEYGKDSDVYRVLVLGEFPYASDLQFISRDIVETAAKRAIQEHQFKFAPVVIGVAPAWTGPDELVIYLRQGFYSKLLYTCLKNDNDIHIAGILAALKENLIR